jgi:FkbM family methyltransferase
VISKRTLVKRIFDQVFRRYLWIKICFQTRSLVSLATLRSLLFSRAQLQQDVFVACFYGFKKSGYFVEFGATDGKSLSNTYLLEKKYQWHGILAEPAKGWQSELRKNRSCNIIDSCVWVESGKKIEFSEARNGEFSTLSNFLTNELHAKKRMNAKSYLVETITLNDLLSELNAPPEIDYLSIDTEGSEYEILKSFDFTKYQINLVTVEHNYSQNRKAIRDLLELQGFVKVRDDLSLWDDWFVNRKVLLDNKFNSFVLSI